MSTDVVVDYDRLLPAEFDARVDAAPVVYQPVGCMEWHGKHLPLGLDGLIGQRYELSPSSRPRRRLA